MRLIQLRLVRMNKTVHTLLHKLSLLMMLLSGHTISAQYLLCKVDENKKIVLLNEEEHATAYKIIVKYAFPMNLNFFHGTDPEKWTEEHQELLEDKCAFITKNLDELDIKVVFIPNTLYELEFLDLYLTRKCQENVNAKNDEITEALSNIGRLYRNATRESEWNYLQFLQASDKYNYSQEAFLLHNTVSSAIIKHCINSNFLVVDEKKYH